MLSVAVVAAGSLDNVVTTVVAVVAVRACLAIDSARDLSGAVHDGHT
jgi:hypothetical protein